MKKAPDTGASEWNLFLQPLFRARPSYFFFFGAAFVFLAAFLVALFIESFSLNIEFCDWKIAM